MASKHYQKVKRVTLAQQKLALMRKYPASIIECEIEKGNLRCNQRVKPTEDSREYIITVEYCIPKYPSVYLINQGIMRNKEDTGIPHCYERNYTSPDKERVKLCLFYPRRGEWNSSMFLSDTIIPWAVEWLYYYEQWRMTGEWYGGGEHPKFKK